MNRRQPPTSPHRGRRAPVALAAATVALLLTLAPNGAARATGILYVNRCSGNCTVTQGPDDAIMGQSSIPNNGTSQLTQFAHDDATFNATVACLRGLFARYDVAIVTSNPGAVARRELMLAGNASQIGLQGTFGVAPVSGNGTALDNVIAFAFANDVGADVDTLCWVGALQVGYVYGLEAEYHCPDIMGYASACGLKTFTDHDAACGTFSAESTCAYTGAATQNAAKRLEANAGLSDRLLLAEFEPPTPAP